MEDKKSIKPMDAQKTLSNLMLAFVFGLSVFISYLTRLNTWWYLLILPSVIVSVLLTGIVHEFGHFIVAKRRGFEVYYLAFPCFVYDKTSKPKLKITLKGEYLGEIRFFPRTAFDYAEAFKNTLQGGIYAHVVIAVMLNGLLLLSVVGVFGEISAILSIAFSFAPYSIYALVVNAIPWFHYANDGSMIKRINSDREEVQAVFNFFSIQKALFEGKSYGEISPSYFSEIENVSAGIRVPLLVFALRRALEIGDKKKADEIVETIIKEGFSDVATDCELLYKFIIDGNEEKIREYENVLTFAENENYPVVLKALLAHAKYRGDDNYFNVTKPTAIRICEETDFCKGDAKYNKVLIERL